MCLMLVSLDFRALTLKAELVGGMRSLMAMKAWIMKRCGKPYGETFPTWADLSPNTGF